MLVCCAWLQRGTSEADSLVCRLRRVLSRAPSCWVLGAGGGLFSYLFSPASGL